MGTACQRRVDTTIACHYADDPVSRPGCTLTATVRFGTIALCLSCETHRSTVGNRQPTLPLPQARSSMSWHGSPQQTSRPKAGNATSKPPQSPGSAKPAGRGR